ncbi:MAG: hypothetical protein ACO3EZ_01175 [Prochlorotrichaceae cyanobacterium]
MGKNWAICIGINRYDNLQPLACAERDAIAVRDFFQTQLKFDRVYFFAENAPPIEQDYGPSLAAHPTYGTLRRFLRVRFENPFLQTSQEGAKEIVHESYSLYRLRRSLLTTTGTKRSSHGEGLNPMCFRQTLRL